MVKIELIGKNEDEDGIIDKINIGLHKLDHYAYIEIFVTM